MVFSAVRLFCHRREKAEGGGRGLNGLLVAKCQYHAFARITFFLFIYLFRVLSPFSLPCARGHSDARTTISPRTFQQRRLLRDGMQTLDRVRRGGCAFSELSPPTSPSCQATDSFHSAHTWRATGSSLVSSFLRVGRRQLPIEINYFVGRQLDSRRYDRNVITPVTASSNYTLSVGRWYFLNLYIPSHFTKATMVLAGGCIWISHLKLQRDLRGVEFKFLLETLSSIYSYSMIIYEKKILYICICIRDLFNKKITKPWFVPQRCDRIDCSYATNESTWQS